ncbi:MAG: hypothetical protein AAFX03_06200 [Pseudomonadota bacterium]
MSDLAVPASPRAARRPLSKAAMVVAGVCAILAALPLLFPLGLGFDYPNHLARTYIVGWLHGSPALQQHYGVTFELIPDLAMDLIVPWLSHLTGIYTAGALAVAAAMILPPLAGVWISRGLNGGQIGLLSLAGFAAAFNHSLEWGFVNYILASGLALFAFGLWMRMAPGLSRSLIFIPIGVALVVSHALAFLLFGYLALLWEIASWREGRRGGMAPFVRKLVLWDGLAMAPGLALLAFATLTAPDLPQLDLPLFHLGEKMKALTAGFQFFNAPLALACFVVVAVAVAFGLRSGVLTIRRDMAFVCGGLAVLVVVIPTGIFGIWGLHVRFTAPLIILLAASVRLADDAARWRTPAAVLVAGLVAAQTLSGFIHFRHYDTAANALRAGLAVMPEGAKLLAVQHEDADNAVAYHGMDLAVIERRAYVPGLFTNTSWVDIQPAMADLHLPQSTPPSPEEFAIAETLTLPASENGFWSLGYFHGWPAHWDYVLYFRPDGTDPLKSQNLCLASEGAGFTLYQVVVTREACA